jgi:hypothetical protein
MKYQDNMTTRTFILVFVVLTLTDCSKKEKIHSDFGNENLNNCRKSDELNGDLIKHKLVDLTFLIPDNWKVRDSRKASGIECLDTLTSTRDAKIRTFTVYEFDSQGTDLLEYCKAQMRFMEERSMTILESGTRTIGKIKSYYVINSDLVDTPKVFQAFCFTDFGSKRYTSIIAVSAATDSQTDLCSSMWIIDSIKFGDTE